MHYRLGAHRADATHWSFFVWAPKAESLELALFSDASNEERRLPMRAEERGYFSLVTDAVQAGSLYKYAFTDGAYPDPASRLQPFGVHGPSQCVDVPVVVAEPQPAVTMGNLVIYELHVGTFTPEGTLAAAQRELPRLAELGITMVELMPICAFPGTRNWGYDGVFPFSVHSAYGGPSSLADFVRAAHQAGLGVMLDVVYNHVGPEGNYLAAFGSYFNDRVLTPWGPALNFDGPDSDEVRYFFAASAEQWVSDFDIDGLRLDAAHEIIDRRATTFLASLTEGLRARAEARGKHLILSAESDANDPRYVTATNELGYGFDAVWCDDLHHALHTVLTGESKGYYADFQGFEHLARAWRMGSSYDGQYSPVRRRKHGRSFARVDPASIIVFSQNHDQVGNRAAGERLTALAGIDAQRLAALVVLTSAYTPLLFMGEEYGETAPFQYFVEHGDPRLIDAVRKGRHEEFASFGWDREVPDAQHAETLERSRIDTRLLKQPLHAAVLTTYKRLLALRREWAVLDSVRDARVVDGVLQLVRGSSAEMVAFVNFGKEPVTVTTPDGRYRRRLDLAQTELGGSGRLAPDELESSMTFELSARNGVIYCR